MLLTVENVKKIYGNGVQALRGVSLSLEKGQTLAVVGESGCGKSTLAKILMKIEDASSGEVRFSDKNIRSLNLKELSHKVQMIFQDPHSSLNPRKKLKSIIKEPLDIQGELTEEQKQDKIKNILKLIGLGEEALEKYPHMFSGGQKQRICIARALVVDPEIIICDEPVSALDLSIQAQVLNLLKEIQAKKNISYLFISHDLSVVKYISKKIAVMYLGEIVEEGYTKDIFKHPQHPYTELLLKSIPKMAQVPKDIQLKAEEMPLNTKEIIGCGFYSRCAYRMEKCQQERPEIKNKVRCFYPLTKPPNQNMNKDL